MRLTVLALALVAPFAAAQTMFLTSLLVQNPDLSSLADALGLVSSSFAGSLGRTPITILAPTNTAFEALSAASPEREAIRSRNSTALQALLSYHVLQGTYKLANFTENPINVTTISNQTYSIARARSIFGGNENIGFLIGGNNEVINVPQADIQTVGNLTIPNVTVHKIDRVLTVSRLSGNASATPSASGTASRTTGAPVQSTGGAAKIGGSLGAAMGLGLALLL